MLKKISKPPIKISKYEIKFSIPDMNSEKGNIESIYSYLSTVAEETESNIREAIERIGSYKIQISIENISHDEVWNI